MILTFDCYGTLVDWETGIAEAFESEAAKDRIEIDRERLIDLYHRIEPEIEAEEFRPYREILQRVALRVADEIGWILDVDRASFLPESLPLWPAFAETNAALERMRDKDWRLGILSNVDDDLIAETSRQFTIDLDLVITAEQVHSYKPAHGHFLEARRRIGDERWVHVAQSYFHDIIPSTELGIECVWINRKGEIASAEPPDFEFKDLENFSRSFSG